MTCCHICLRKRCAKHRRPKLERQAHKWPWQVRVCRAAGEDDGFVSGTRNEKDARAMVRAFNELDEAGVLYYAVRGRDV